MFHKERIYISSDIEGVARCTDWSECNRTNRIYEIFRTIMSVELATMAEAVIKPSKVVIRDAHGSAENILGNLMPKNVSLLQGWNTDPANMMRGINQKKWQFACLHGYHAAGGTDLSPLAHTFSFRAFKEFRLNGEIVGETTFAVLSAAYFGVPLIYVCGDYGAVAEAQKLNPHIVGTITKKFNADDAFILSEKEVLAKIKTDFIRAQNMFYENSLLFRIELPKSFSLTLQYNDEEQAELHAKKYISKLRRIDADTLEYVTTDYWDLLKMLRMMKLKIK